MFDDAGSSRRDFFKAAVALGGATALSACLERLGGDGAPDEPVPRGTDDLGALPASQHAWNDYCPTDDAGNVRLPRHQTFLYLVLPGDGPPDAGARRTVAAALRTLDRAYERSHAGLLHSLAYSPAYFARFDGVAPEGVDLPEPRRLSDFETPTLDRQDALLHLASDRPDALLEAEEALRGNRETANGLDVEAVLTDALVVDDRRTGFIGRGMPAERAEGLNGVPSPNPVPEDAPLFMGFAAGFRGNQATEAYVTLDEGPFAGGTTKHVSRLRQRLDDWYGEQSFDERVAELFSPRHAEEGLVEGAGWNLGDDSGIDATLDTVREDAERHGRAGHAQKAARANRDAEGNVRLLRRHVESTDDGEASLHFPSLQRSIREFEAVREAMNGADLTDIPTVRQRVNNGILEYVFVRNRGNFLVPPRSLRALPTPDGRTPGLDS